MAEKGKKKKVVPKQEKKKPDATGLLADEIMVVLSKSNIPDADKLRAVWRVEGKITPKKEKKKGE